MEKSTNSVRFITKFGLKESTNLNEFKNKVGLRESTDKNLIRNKIMNEVREGQTVENIKNIDTKWLN